MTGELRSILFHVRQRLVQIQGSLIQDQAAAASQPMTVGDAIRYLKQAINLELARTYAGRRAPAVMASRAEREALCEYLEAENGRFDDASTQISELIADLLHLTIQIDRDHDAVEKILRTARESFEQPCGPDRKQKLDEVGGE